MELPRSLYCTLILIKRYIEERGSEYFTYNGIKAFAAKTGFYREYGLTDRTLDRSIRKLCELGYLKRIVRGRKKVLFTPSTNYYYWLQRYEKLLRNSRVKN